MTPAVLHGKWRYKSHLVFPWINSIMRLPQVLDLVGAILGADLMVWTSHCTRRSRETVALSPGIKTPRTGGWIRIRLSRCGLR